MSKKKYGVPKHRNPPLPPVARVTFDEQPKDDHTFKCDCHYPCDNYPHCGGHKITFDEQPEKTTKSKLNMKKKVVYITQWVARDLQKEYPHGRGFEPPIVEFDQNTDPVKAAEACRELSNDEFECIGAIPREMIDGDFEILGIIPGPEPDSEEWVIRDIDIILDNADFGNDWKIKQISNAVRKLNSGKSQPEAAAAGQELETQHKCIYCNGTGYSNKPPLGQ